jgi:hypothetical protein
MGRCPVRVGTNVPNIHEFQPNIYLEQFKSENGPQRRMSHRNLSISECGMVDSVILSVYSHMGLELSFNTYDYL